MNKKESITFGLIVICFSLIIQMIVAYELFWFWIIYNVLITLFSLWVFNKITAE